LKWYCQGYENILLTLYNTPITKNALRRSMQTDKTANLTWRNQNGPIDQYGLNGQQSIQQLTHYWGLQGAKPSQWVPFLLPIRHESWMCPIDQYGLVVSWSYRPRWSKSPKGHSFNNWFTADSALGGFHCCHPHTWVSKGLYVMSWICFIAQSGLNGQQGIDSMSDSLLGLTEC